ncbi:MAG: FtsB family cell division protein [Elusimicrobiota bacterium]
MKKAGAFARSHWPRILISCLLIAVFFGNQGFRSLIDNGLELLRLRAEIAQLHAQKRDLSKQLALLESGGSSIESLARVQLGYIKKGEVEYRFEPPASDAQ